MGGFLEYLHRSDTAPLLTSLPPYTSRHRQCRYRASYTCYLLRWEVSIPACCTWNSAAVLHSSAGSPRGILRPGGVTCNTTTLLYLVGSSFILCSLSTTTSLSSYSACTNSPLLPLLPAYHLWDLRLSGAVWEAECSP